MQCQQRTVNSQCWKNLASRVGDGGRAWQAAASTGATRDKTRRSAGFDCVGSTRTHHVMELRPWHCRLSSIPDPHLVDALRSLLGQTLSGPLANKGEPSSQASGRRWSQGGPGAVSRPLQSRGAGLQPGGPIPPPVLQPNLHHVSVAKPYIASRCHHRP
jgi:hypothetical protein